MANFLLGMGIACAGLALAAAIAVGSGGHPVASIMGMLLAVGGLVAANGVINGSR